MKKFSTNIENLKSSESYIGGAFKSFVQDFLKAASRELEIEELSFWRIINTQQTLKPLALYQMQVDDFQDLEGLQSQKIDRAFPKKFSWFSNIDATLPEVLDQIRKRRGYKNVLSVQLWLSGSLYGVLIAGNHSGRSIAREQFFMLTSLGNSMMQEVLNLATQKQSEKFTPKINDIPIPILIYHSRDHQILDANQYACKTYEKTLEELKEMTIDDLAAWDQQKGINQDFIQKAFSPEEQRALIKQATDRFKNQLTEKDITQSDARIAVHLGLDNLLKEKEELSRKITDHAFFTSHNIRSPLANILGLIDLIQYSWDDHSTYEDLIYRLKVQVMILDEAIRVMTAKIELD